MEDHITRQEKAQRLIDRFYNNYYNLTKEQLKDAINFDKQNQTNDLSTVTRANYFEAIGQFCKSIKIPFKKITKKQLMDYLNKRSETLSPTSFNQTKINLKKFFNFIYGMPKGKYPSVIEWVQIGVRERHKKKDKKIITEEEYMKLIKGCQTQRDRAIISFLYSTGCRIGELVNTRIRDLTFDRLGRYVTIRLVGKTGEREVVMTSGVCEIDAYLKQHPYNSNKNSPLFLTLPKSNRANEKLGHEGISNMLEELSHRTIDRHVHPHLLRHTFATKLASKYTDAEMRVVMGWSKSSPMPSHYTWLRDKHVNKKMLIEAGIEKEEEQIKEAYRDIKCTKCGTMNSFDSERCRNCLFCFSSEAVQEIDRTMNKTFKKHSIDKDFKQNMMEELESKIINKLKLKQLV